MFYLVRNRINQYAVHVFLTRNVETDFVSADLLNHLTNAGSKNAEREKC